jgi:choline dehydrogenase-like flavoprotein
LGSILEDDPNPSNRVEPTREGMRLTYRLSPGDVRRRQMLRRKVWRAFRRFGPVRVFGTSDREALGHVCGTTRFGDKSAENVLDRFNRAHQLDNLYVVDSGFFPTSGGINPALTVAANALRIAHHLEDVL